MKKSELVVGQSYWYNSDTNGWQRSGVEARLVSLTPTEKMGWNQRRSKSHVTVELLRLSYETEDSRKWVRVNVLCSHLRGDYEMLKKRAGELRVKNMEREVRERIAREELDEHFRNVYTPKFDRFNELLRQSGGAPLHSSNFGSPYSTTHRIPEETLDVLIDAMQIRLGHHEKG